MRIAILGAGNLGTALGIVLAGGTPGIRAGRNREVVLWTIEPDVARDITEARHNSKYLPGVALPKGLRVTLDLAEAVTEADAILLSVPSKVVRTVSRDLAKALPPASSIPWPPVVSAAKGLEEGTFKRMTEIIAQELPESSRGPILAVSGPSIAHELARGVPTAITLAHAEPRTARAVRRHLQTPILRFQISRDVAGVELGGVLKNAYTLAFGLCDGLGLGLNTKAALLTRAVPEMARLGAALGGRRSTFYDLPGLGDLVGTGLSDHSRNRRMGEELARRRPREEALAGIPGVVEGIGSLLLTRDLAKQRGLRFPILEGLHAIIQEGADPVATMMRLIV